MKLPFTIVRPIGFFDTETTGVSVVNDKIVELSILKYMPDATLIHKHIIIDPERPIPKAASDVHKITDDRISELKAQGLAPIFTEVAKDIYEFLSDCDLGGYNIDFDIPILSEEFARVGIQWPAENTLKLDAFSIFVKEEPRNLTEAVRYYLGEDLKDAHSASADTIASFKILNVQCRGYESLRGKTLEQVAEYCKRDNRIDLAGKLVKNEEGRVMFNFGKHKDKFVYDVFKTDFSYYKFLMRSEFTTNTKMYFEKYYNQANSKK